MPMDGKSQAGEEDASSEENARSMAMPEVKKPFWKAYSFWILHVVGSYRGIVWLTGAYESVNISMSATDESLPRGGGGGKRYMGGFV